MANITPTETETNDKGVVIAWPGATSGDVGLAVQVLRFGEMTHSAVGTFTTVTWQGSNDGGTTWGALGAGATDTVSGTITRLPEHPMLVRPSFTTLGGATIAYLTGARQYY